MKSFRGFHLDTSNQCLWHGEERLPIPPKAYDMLRYLVENPRRLVTQEELLEKLWPEVYVNPELIRKYILDIRKILGDRPEKPDFIETMPKRGYRFIAPVIEENLPDPANPSISDTTTKHGSLDSIPPRATNPQSQRLSGRRSVGVLFLVVLLAAAAVAGIGRERRHLRNPAISNDVSIAVLPFSDMSATRDQEYFSDGLAEQLIHDLAKVPGVRVAGRSSAFQFKGKNEDLRVVGRKLGVANILEGSVRRDGNRLRITAELIKAEDGFQLWSQRTIAKSRTSLPYRMKSPAPRPRCCD